MNGSYLRHDGDVKWGAFLRSLNTCFNRWRISPEELHNLIHLTVALTANTVLIEICHQIRCLVTILDHFPQKFVGCVTILDHFLLALRGPAPRPTQTPKRVQRKFPPVPTPPAYTKQTQAALLLCDALEPQMCNFNMSKSRDFHTKITKMLNLLMWQKLTFSKCYLTLIIVEKIHAVFERF